MTISTRYNPEADALYLELAKSDGWTEEQAVYPDVVLMFDATGKIVGVGIRPASQVAAGDFAARALRRSRRALLAWLEPSTSSANISDSRRSTSCRRQPSRISPRPFIAWIGRAAGMSIAPPCSMTAIGQS
jgi:uncharacterized protein YuzE